MEFEELQAIWDTQTERPVFSLQDARLLIALYQQREHSRRQLFKRHFLPLFIMAPIGLFGVAFTLFAFYWRSVYIEKLARDFPMSGWDYLAFAVAAVSLIAMVAPMYAERRRHERSQQVFAPSLKEELDRGVAQLDFEASLLSVPKLVKLYGFLTVAVTLFTWEIGRLNGNATSWNMVWTTLPIMAVTLWASFVATKPAVERLMERRRALESMRAALDEPRS